MRRGTLNTRDITSPGSQPFYHVASMTMEEICIAMLEVDNNILYTLFDTIYMAEG